MKLTKDLCLVGPTLYTRFADKFEDWVYLQGILDGHDGWPYTDEKAKSQTAAMMSKLPSIKFPYSDKGKYKLLHFGCLKTTGLPVTMAITVVIRYQARTVYRAVHPDYRRQGVFAEHLSMIAQLHFNILGGKTSVFEIPADQKFTRMTEPSTLIDSRLKNTHESPIEYQEHILTKEQYDSWCLTDYGKKALVPYTIHETRPKEFPYV